MAMPTIAEKRTGAGTIACPSIDTLCGYAVVVELRKVPLTAERDQGLSFDARVN